MRISIFNYGCCYGETSQCSEGTDPFEHYLILGPEYDVPCRGDAFLDVVFTFDSETFTLNSNSPSIYLPFIFG
jgi:hypothetical protein